MKGAGGNKRSASCSTICISWRSDSCPQDREGEQEEGREWEGEAGTGEEEKAGYITFVAGKLLPVTTGD